MKKEVDLGTVPVPI